jgi:hypothetical protein
MSCFTPSICGAVTVTFTDLPSEYPIGTHSEAGMAFAGGSAPSFAIDSEVGNPPSAIFSASPGDFGPGLIFNRVGGGPFTFDRFDFASGFDPFPSDTVEFTGLLAGSEVFSFQVSTSISTFTSQATGESSVIDELVLSTTRATNAGLDLDNFNFTIVPEPSAALLLLSGCLAVAAWRSLCLTQR